MFRLRTVSFLYWSLVLILGHGQGFSDDELG